jgi:hypothetical protein
VGDKPEKRCQFQRNAVVLGLSSYKTAQALLHKLGRAVVRDGGIASPAQLGLSRYISLEQDPGKEAVEQRKRHLL